MRIETTPRVRAVVVATGIILIGLLHRLIPPHLIHWHNALQNLYYLPILLAGWSFGWRGGLGAAILASVANLPLTLEIWDATPGMAIDLMWDIPLFCAAGALSGVLAERERAQRAALERTTERLTEVYQELQDNFERMKRAERLFALGQLSSQVWPTRCGIRWPALPGQAASCERNVRFEAREAECLGIISKECHRLDRLVEAFLAFARAASSLLSNGRNSEAALIPFSNWRPMVLPENRLRSARRWKRQV